MAGRIENLTPWKPGQSGNAAGRPKKLDHVLEELLLADDSRAAREIALALIQRAKNGDVKAAQFIAERTEGKPRQKVEHTGVDGSVLANTIVVRFVQPGEATEDIQERPN